MITYKLHLIRHGKIAEEFQGKYIGRNEDVPLSSAGVDELEQLVADKTYPPAQKVYTSPLLRCTQTADILYPDRWCVPVEELAEFDFGDFGGKGFAELKDNPAFVEFVAGKNAENGAPNGENTLRFNARVKEAVKLIFDDMMQNGIRSAVVITHGGVMMSMLSQLSLPRQNYYDWAVENGTGYTVLLTPAMWLRDEGFEVQMRIPYRIIEDEMEQTDPIED